MAGKRKNKKLPAGQLPIDILQEERDVVSSAECTGLTPRAVKTEAETEAYEKLFHVDVPDN